MGVDGSGDREVQVVSVMHSLGCPGCSSAARLAAQKLVEHAQRVAAVIQNTDADGRPTGGEVFHSAMVTGLPLGKVVVSAVGTMVLRDARDLDDDTAQQLAEQDEEDAAGRAAVAARARLVVERSCRENWPGAESGSYDPRCCRFPKSCSAQLVEPDDARA